MLHKGGFLWSFSFIVVWCILLKGRSSFFSGSRIIFSLGKCWHIDFKRYFIDVLFISAVI